MSTLFNYPKFKAFDTNGNFLVGGKLWTYQTGTVSLKPTYHDKDLAQPHTNPIILDANGEAIIYFSSDGVLYDLILTDANDVQLWTMDSIGGIGNVNTAGSVVANEIALFFDSSGTVIKGGLGDTGKIGIVELENGITLSDDSGADRLFVKIGDAGAADLTVDDIDCNDIHATGNIIADETATIGGITTFGKDAVILTTDDNETATLRNAADSDYAYLHCKNIITGDIGHEDYSLLYNGRTDTVIATSGYITAEIDGRVIELTLDPHDFEWRNRLIMGKYKITFTDFNPLTDGTISIMAWASIDNGDEVTLIGSDPENPYIFNGTLVEETGTLPMFRRYVNYDTYVTVTPITIHITDIDDTSVTLSTIFSASSFDFKSEDGGSTWVCEEPSPFTEDGYSITNPYVDWISVYVKKIKI